MEKSSGLFHVASNQKARSIVNRPFCILFAPPLTVMEEALDVIERLLDGEQQLEHFGLHTEGERVVSLEGREFLSKRDYRRLRAALDLGERPKRALVPVLPNGGNKGKAKGEIEDK